MSQASALVCVCQGLIAALIRSASSLRGPYFCERDPKKNLKPLKVVSNPSLNTMAVDVGVSRCAASPYRT